MSAPVEQLILDGLVRRGVALRSPSDHEVFFDAAIDLFAILDGDWSLDLANEAWVRVLGWSMVELHSAPLTRLLHPDDHAAFLALKPALEDGAVGHLENRYRCADGGWRWLLWSAFAQDGRYYCAAKDVTERKLAELAIAESERRARAVLDAVPDGLLLLDTEGRVVDVNERFGEMIGLRREQILGLRPPFPWWPDRDHKELVGLSREGDFSTRTRVAAEFQRPSGDRFPVTVDVSPRLSADGSPEGTLRVIRDESERIQTRTLLRDVQSLAKIAEWTLDPRTSEVHFGAPRSRHEDVAPSPGQVRPVEELLDLIPEPSRTQLRQALESVLGDASPRTLEYSVCDERGSTRWYRSLLRARIGRTGEAVGVHGVSQDITHQRATDEQLALAYGLQQATLDSLPARIAVLDAEGTIVAANRAWTQFTDANGRSGVAVGASYLDVCTQAALSDETAARMSEQLRAVLGGARAQADLEYPCHSPSVQQWFAARVTPMSGRSDLFVVTHEDVTKRRLAELAGQVDRERLREAHRVARLGGWELDLEQDEFVMSAQLAELFGEQGARSMPSHEMLTRVHPADRQRVVTCFNAAFGQAGPVTVEWRYERGGEVRWAESRGQVVVEEGRGRRLHGVTQDTTVRKRAERQIHTQASLLDAVDAAVLAIDPQNLVTFCNAGFERLTGIGTTAALGRPLSDFVVGDRDESGPDTRPFAEELALHAADGTVIAVQARRRPLLDEQGEVVGGLIVAVDISARVRAERQLRGAHDFLSAVADGVGDGILALDDEHRVMYMNETAERLLGWELADAREQGLVDVVGLPLDDLVRRDEAAVVCRDGTFLPVSVRASAFVTAAKEPGTVIVFHDISARKAEQQRLLTFESDVTCVRAIRAALAEDRFVLYAQPIVEVDTGRQVQQELLIRMLDVDGSLIAPGRFLPVAERSGLIVEIDRWVVREALKIAAAGQGIEVNLSAHSVGDPEMLAFFERALRESGAEPNLVVVELTETALLERPDVAERFVRRLQALGCKFALDDFGTGYGGFSYLKRLPVSFLKIDIEFVRDLPRDPEGRTVIEAVVALARGFGRKTVAEGVEDQETLDILCDLGVDYAQGYGIARPAPLI